MSHASRVRRWLEVHGPALDALRVAEIRLVTALDAARRIGPGRHEDNAALSQETAASAAALELLTGAALQLPAMPDLDADLYFRAACRRWLAAVDVLTGDASESQTSLERAALEVVVGRDELLRSIELMKHATRLAR